MKKHRKTVLAAIMLILVVASAVFAARVHTVSLDAENVAKITAKRLEKLQKIDIIGMEKLQMQYVG